MANKVKTPWYKRIYGFFTRGVTGSFGSFMSTLFAVWGIFLTGVIVYGLFNPVNPADKIESTTTYSETSMVVPVYTHAKEGSDDFKKVIADLEFYNTKPERTEVSRFVKYSFGNRGTEVTDSLIDGKDAESLYYHAKGSPMGFIEDFFNSLLEDSREDIGTIIFYNKAEKTYTSKPIKGIKIHNKSTKGRAEGYYHREYEGYQGASKPVYSYSPTVELIAYKDGTYEWKSSDNWKLDNEDELKAYISSSPKKED